MHHYFHLAIRNIRGPFSCAKRHSFRMLKSRGGAKSIPANKRAEIAQMKAILTRLDGGR